MNSDTDNPKDYVRSLARGLDVIVALGHEPDGMTLSEAASAVSLDRATARRLLLTLQRLGYVKFDDRRFSLTARTLNLGYAYLSSTPLWELASPYIQDLADHTNQSCSVGVLDNGEVVYIARAQSTKRRMTINVSIGTRFPAFNTSMGRVLLGNLPPNELDAYLKSDNFEKYTDRTVTDPKALRKIALKARDEGWCYGDQEMEDGIRSLAVPIHGRDGLTIAAMNISAQASQVSEEQLLGDFLSRLKEAAHEIEAVIRAR